MTECRADGKQPRPCGRSCSLYSYGICLRISCMNILYQQMAHLVKPFALACDSVTEYIALALASPRQLFIL